MNDDYYEAMDLPRKCHDCGAVGFSLITGCNCKPEIDDDGMEPEDDGMYGWEPDEDDYELDNGILRSIGTEQDVLF